MIDTIIKKVTGAWRKVKLRWGEMTKGQKEYTLLGFGVVVAGVLVGGALQQAVITGLIFNTLLWMMLSESEWSMGIMRKYGKPIDLTITIVGFIFGGGAGVTALMVGVVVGALFSVFRVFFCGTPDGDVVVEGAEPQEVAA